MIEMIVVTQNIQSLFIRTSKYFPLKIHELKTPILLRNLESIQINFEARISSHINLMSWFKHPSQRYFCIDFFNKRKIVFIQKTYSSVWSHRHEVILSLQNIINAIKVNFLSPVPLKVISKLDKLTISSTDNKAILEINETG